VSVVCERRQAKLKKMQKQQINERKENKTSDVRKIKIGFWNIAGLDNKDAILGIYQGI